MGLIKAALGAAGGVMADQWLEYFYCDSLPENVMAVKGQKRSSGRSSNTRGSDNIISNGSVIAVADGQCMVIVDQGKVTEFCAEPGEFKYDASTEPSLFYGKLGKNILDTFKNIGKRYRRQDEIGTPFCVTYDFDSESDNAVTVRDRDTMEQERVSLDNLKTYLSEKING